jgi:regulator of protease activity HflC (stomatin/prohibitin superfamily)
MNDEETGEYKPLKVIRKAQQKRNFVSSEEASIGYDAYNVVPLTTDYECKDTAYIQYVPRHSGSWKLIKALVCLVTLPISWLWVAFRTYNIPKGSIGVSQNSGKPEFLPPGWHFIGSPLRRVSKIVSLTTSEQIVNLTRGIVTIPDGFVGLAKEQGKFILLGPGMHQWDSDTFRFQSFHELAKSNVLHIGAFTLVTVPPGEVAITENNGVLQILEENEGTKQRTHFLNHAKWQFKGFLSTQVQIDNLNTSNLLTADRVEVSLDSTISWRLIDPHLAAARGGHNMDSIRELVHRAARATLSNMIALRNISDKAVGQMAEAKEVHKDDDEEQHASRHQLERCNVDLRKVGAELTQIAIVQMKILHEDTRKEIAKIAAIPAKTKEMRDVASANADNVRIAATGQAQAIVEVARATAESISLIADAQKKAGEMLGGKDSTAAILAQIEATGKALGSSKSSVFFVPPGNIQGLMANQNFLHST